MPAVRLVTVPVTAGRAPAARLGTVLVTGEAVLVVTELTMPVIAADVWRVVRRLAVQAGLPDHLACHLGPQAMRHSFATLYLDAGGSLRDLQKVMGHADMRTTRRYDPGQQVPERSPGDVVAAYLAAAWRPAGASARPSR